MNDYLRYDNDDKTFFSMFQTIRLKWLLWRFEPDPYKNEDCEWMPAGEPKSPLHETGA